LTLFRWTFGDVDYPSVDQAGLVMGPLLYTLFMFFVSLLLLNLLIAVLTEAYTTVHERNTQQWERSITLLMIAQLKKDSGIRATVSRWWKSKRGGSRDVEIGGGVSEYVDTSEKDSEISWTDSELDQLIDSSSAQRKITLKDLLSEHESAGARLGAVEERTKRIENILQELVLRS
jgi:Polycystin cation channel